MVNLDAIHSLVSLSFFMRFRLASKSLKCPLLEATPISDTFKVNMIFSSCPIKMNDKGLSGDLIPLLVMDFDIILRKD